MRVYLAGPMRGYPDNNRPAFAEAATRLRRLGHEVFSPAEADAGLAPGAAPEDGTVEGRRFYFRRDLDALLQQEGIVLLPGWGQSHGAVLERHAAEVVGLPAYQYETRVEGHLRPLEPIDWRKS